NDRRRLGKSSGAQPPAQSACRIKGKKGAVDGSKVNASILGQSRRGNDRAAGGIFPFLVPVRSQRVELVVMRPKIDGPIQPDGRRGDDRAAGRELPSRRSVRVERI